MRHRHTSAWWLLCIAFTLGLASCSSSESLHPVKGKVTQAGQPLSGAKVVFHPASGTSTDWPSGTTDSNGEFTLNTAGREGAAEGSYKISIVCMQPSTAKPDGMAMPEEVDRLKGAYANPATTNLTAEVKSGPNQLEPFVLP